MDDSQEPNARFQWYYRTVNGVISDEEWPAFSAAIRKPLPITFRISGFRSPAARALRDHLEERFFTRIAEVSRVPRPRAFSWYPDK